jgi:HJR/Mrr/RecB family endonuclease
MIAAVGGGLLAGWCRSARFLLVSCAIGLGACGGGGGTDAALKAPSGLAIAYGLKTLNFTWSAVEGASTYRFFERTDAAAPFSPVGGPLTATSMSQQISVLLHQKLNASYAVQACNADGCGGMSTAVQPDLNQAIGYVKASNTEADDRFGREVALSADGSTLAVATIREASDATGVNGDQTSNAAANAGAVYVFSRTAGIWTQQAYLKASNTRAGHFFGASLALSADGGTLAVGAMSEDSSAVGINGDQTPGAVPNAGAVYVFTRIGGDWLQQAYVKASNTDRYDGFGGHLAISADGNTLAVGATGEGSDAAGINGDELDNNAAYAGAVYVFLRAGGTWTQQAYVKASNSQGSDIFGASVALSADGNTLAVGANLEHSGALGVGGDQWDETASFAGAVYVFTRSGVTWSQQAYVKASNTQADALFGKSLALSADGNTLAVGAIGESSSATGIDGDQGNRTAIQAGAVYVFTRAGGAWSQQAYVKASNTARNNGFGETVALSGDGNTMVVGAIHEAGDAKGINGSAGNTAPSSGAAYVFARAGTTWTQSAYLKASNTQANDQFGSSLALSADGTTLVAGAPQEGSKAVGIQGNQSNEGAPNAGAVYVY